MPKTKTKPQKVTADKNLLILAAVVVILSATIFFIVRGRPMPQPLTSTPQLTLNLSSQNDSGEFGTAILTEAGGKVTVSLSLTGAPTGVAQPAHIHVGSCPTPGAVKYPLTNVVNGKSETTLNVTLAELKSQLPLALNVHKSASQASVYVSCGNFPL